MSESLWGKQGATLSHKNACKEFGLTEEEVIEGIKEGKLQYRQNYAHGNPYFRLLRVEVERLSSYAKLLLRCLRFAHSKSTNLDHILQVIDLN